MKRKRTFSFDLGSAKKRRAELLKEIEKDVHNWSKEPREKKLHRYFTNETKLIWLEELLHAYFTIVSADQHLRGLGDEHKKMVRFFRESGGEGHGLSKEECRRCKDIVKGVDIRRVYPFTISEQPVRKLKSLCF